MAPPLATYTYDAQGRRIQKQVGTQTTRSLSDGPQMLAEYSATGSLMARTVHGPGLDEPLLMVRGGRFSYLHQDGLGSVTAATDTRGVLVESYQYRAFGEPTVLGAAGTVVSGSAIGNPYLFTGREFDAETELHYYRNRYYSQTVGRFLTRDPFPGSPTNPASWHRYSYVANNPINRLDPLGLRTRSPGEESRLEKALEIGGTLLDVGLIVLDIAPITGGPTGEGFAAVAARRAAKEAAEEVAERGLRRAGREAAEEAAEQAGRGAAKQGATKVDRLKEHLTERDLRAAREELAGKPIAKPRTGEPYQHVKEVQDAQQGLVREIEHLKRELGHPNLSAAERAEIQRQLGEASKLLDHTEGFVPR